MIIVDTSALLAFFNRAEPAHVEVAAVMESTRGPYLVSPYVVAEVDYLVATRHGVEAELAILQELAGGAWTLAHIDEDDLMAARSVIDRYRDQEVGAADASLVVLADRHATRRILTLDRRHFDVLRPLGGGRFTLLPKPR
jgi:uncharacterized protein